MLKFVVLVFVALQVVSCASVDRVKRSKVKDKGDYLLICKHEPIDLGIVLDSSSSIRGTDFKKGLVFLQDFIKQFQIGNGRNDVRVSVITYGFGIYPDNGFNLTTYNTREAVSEAIGKIQHEAGLYTDTGKAIKWMNKVQMTPFARDYAEKVSIVITDGNSQEWRVTEREAKIARESGIKMFAVGVGNVREEELLRIAGNSSRVTKVDNYDDLKNIVNSLAKETCIRKNKPTTTPPPPTECGEEYPADINFVFSPAELGVNGTLWATNFMSLVVDNEDMQVGFRYGAVTGTCPEDEGFTLNEYTVPEETEQLKDRLREYERYRLPGLVDRVVQDGFSDQNGGREDADDVVVLIATDVNLGHLEEDVQLLLEEGITVFIADPYNLGIDINGALTLSGPGARGSAEHFVQALCG